MNPCCIFFAPFSVLFFFGTAFALRLRVIVGKRKKKRTDNALDSSGTLDPARRRAHRWNHEKTPQAAPSSSTVTLPSADLPLHLAQRCRKLWSSLCHFPLLCVSTLMVLIPVLTSDVRQIVWSTFLWTRTPHKPKLCVFHEPQRNRSRKAFIELFKIVSKNASNNEIVSVLCYQSVRGSVGTPNCPILPRSPSTHRRQEPVNRQLPTSWCVSKSIHSFREPPTPEELCVVECCPLKREHLSKSRQGRTGHFQRGYLWMLVPKNHNYGFLW